MGFPIEKYKLPDELHELDNDIRRLGILSVSYFDNRGLVKTKGSFGFVAEEIYLVIVEIVSKNANKVIGYAKIIDIIHIDTISEIVFREKESQNVIGFHWLKDEEGYLVKNG